MINQALGGSRPSLLRVDQPFEHSLDAVQRWRPDAAHGVSMGCATIDARSDDAPDLLRLELHFQARGRRSLPMELRLTPWSDTDTHVELPSERSAEVAATSAGVAWCSTTWSERSLQR